MITTIRKAAALVAAVCSIAAVVPAVASANPTQPYNKCHGLQFKASLAGFPPGTVANPVSVSSTDAQALLTAGDAECASIDIIDGGLTSSGGLRGLFPAGSKVHSIGSVVGTSTTTHVTGTNPYGTEWFVKVTAYVRTTGHPKHGTAVDFTGTIVPGLVDGFPSVTFVKLSQSDPYSY